jgi:hypothetical protein
MCKSKPQFGKSYTCFIDGNYHAHAVLCDHSPTEEQIKVLQPSYANTDVPDSYDMTSQLLVKMNNVLILIIASYLLL